MDRKNHIMQLFYYNTSYEICQELFRFFRESRCSVTIDVRLEAKKIEKVIEFC